MFPASSESRGLRLLITAVAHGCHHGSPRRGTAESASRLNSHVSLSDDGGHGRGRSSHLVRTHVIPCADSRQGRLALALAAPAVAPSARGGGPVCSAASAHIRPDRGDEHQIGTEGGITSAVLITAVVIAAAIALGAIVVAALWFAGALYSDDESDEADFDDTDTHDWE